MREIKCPCYECICVPVCRYRHFFDMHYYCDLSRNYLFESSGYRKRAGYKRKVTKMWKILKPTRWNVEYNKCHPYIAVLNTDRKKEFLFI